MAGHPAEADLALPLRELGELAPLGILHAAHVVHRVVVVDVDVVGAQAFEARLERAHHPAARVTRPGLGLGCDHHAVAHPGKRLSDRLLRGAESVALRGVEVGHAPFEGMSDERGIAETARSEGNVGHLEAGASEGDEAANPGRLRGLHAAAQPGSDSRSGGRSQLQKSTSSHPSQAAARPRSDWLHGFPPE